MDHQDVGRGGMNRTDLVQDNIVGRAVVNAVMSIGVPQNAGNFLIS